MKNNMKTIISIVMLIFFVKGINCGDQHASKEIAAPDFKEIRGGGSLFWGWLKRQMGSEQTFIGRCLGIGRKLKFVIPLIIFALGVILTTLKFLTLLTLKGIGIGLILLIMNIAGWAGKIATWKAQLEHHHSSHHQPQNIHFHVNKDFGGHPVEHSSSDSGWYDRISDGLSKTSTMQEKIELLNMYKRLGFNLDELSLRYR